MLRLIRLLIFRLVTILGFNRHFVKIHVGLVYSAVDWWIAGKIAGRIERNVCYEKM